MPLVPRSGKPKKTLKAPRRLRPPRTDIIRISRATPNRLGFSFTADIIEKLAQMHMALYGSFYWQIIDPRYRWRTLRLQFVRFADLRIPAVFVHMEPPTFDPRGKRLQRTGNNAFSVEIVATKLKVRHAGFPSHIADHYWAEQGVTGLNGIIINLPEEFMEFNGPRLPFRSSGIAELRPNDLVAY